MADAKLTIRIEGDQPPAPPGGGNGAGGGGSGGGGGGGGSGFGAYQRQLAALNGNPIGPAGRSFSDIAAASMSAPAGSYGRPADATDEEWAFYQLENNRRAVRAAKDAERLRKKAQADQKKAEAEAERLRKEQEAEENAKQAAFAQRAAAIAGPLAAAAAGKGTFAGAGSVAGGVAGNIFGEKAGSSLGGALGGTLGAAAGPIGSAVGTVVGSMIGEKVGKVIDFVLSPFENMQKAMMFAGEAAKKVAGNDGFGFLMQGLEGTANALSAIPIAGTIAAGALRTVGVAAKVAVETLNAFADRGKEIAGYSGAISVAQANQNVYKTLADISEAQRFGGGYARVIDAQTQFEASMRGLLAPIKEVILKYLPVLVEKGLDSLEGILEFLDKIHGGSTFFKEMLKSMRDERELAKALKAIDTWATFFPAGPLPMMPIGTSGPTGGPLGLPVGGPGGSPFPSPFAP